MNHSFILTQRDCIILSILCAGNYTVSRIPFGLKIEIDSSVADTYNITIMENGNEVTETTKNSSYEFKYLKPCTEYGHQITFTDNKSGKIHTCNASTNSTSTDKMGE